MTEEMKPEAPKTPEEVKTEIVEETKAETEQIKVAAASVAALVAYCIAHPVRTIAIILALGLVIAFSVSGWKVGTIEKSAVELRK